MLSTAPEARRSEFPAPDDDALSHSGKVVARVRQAIQDSGGVLPFDRYMEIVLYEPGLGYYVSSTRKFGSTGDFITAPELGALFGRCLARQCADVLKAVPQGSLLEFGAGSGALAVQVLDELAVLDALPEAYLIVELSPVLRDRQRQALEPVMQRVPVHWLDAPPEAGFRGVVLANEVLDAMPVTRFQVQGNAGVAAGVTEDAQGFAWAWASDGCPVPVVDRVVQQYGLGEGYTSEVSPRGAAWIETIGQCLEAGLLLVIDYGYPGAEYYHPERTDGTLMCHYRHRAHGDPFRYPGLQDLTAHVDFSAMAHAGVAAGLELAGFTSQDAFLLSMGILDLASENRDDGTQLRLVQELKQLTLGSEMGESFKVLAMVKNTEESLAGFSLRDRAASL